ncbi:hypothetical protein LXL04_031508 [Taraxacum kok-saghyz]
MTRYIRLWGVGLLRGSLTLSELMNTAPRSNAKDALWHPSLTGWRASTLYKAPLSSSLPLSRHLSAVLFHPTSTHSRQAKLRIHGWDPTSATNIHFHEFKTPNFESPPPDPNASNKFPSHRLPSFQLPSHLREPFAKLLAEIAPTTRRVVIIHDYLMSSVVQDVVSYENAESFDRVEVENGGGSYGKHQANEDKPLVFFFSLFALY